MFKVECTRRLVFVVKAYLKIKVKALVKVKFAMPFIIKKMNLFFIFVKNKRQTILWLVLLLIKTKKNYGSVDELEKR